MKKILLFATFWFILNLIQSVFTEIIDDEAYYWIYSQFLDWGYFDHPPLIALLIRAGGALFQGEPGVRLLPSLLGAGTVFLVFYMLRDEVRDKRLLMLITFSVPLFHFHVAGFIATPDLPLVFSSSLFFLVYRRFLKKDSIVNILLLSFSVALMLYSKYHAFLVVGFTILSNLKILIRRSFWMVTALSVVLFVPHFIWQVRHDFVSFGYHLVDRSNPFQIRFLAEYIGNQLLLVGPLVGIILLCIGISRRANHKFESALKVNLLGFFLFFLISSLRGHVEPHWTAAAFVPMVLLSAPVIDRRLRLRKWVYILGSISVPLMILVRLSLVVEFSFMPEKLSRRFFLKEELYRQIEKEANGRAVVFTNSYQDASLYRFFTGQTAFSQNNKHYRRNQYDLLNLEAELQGKPVLYFPQPGFPGCDTLETIRGGLVMHETGYFCHFNRVEVILPDLCRKFEAGEQVMVNLQLRNPTDRVICFCDSCTHRSWLVYSYFSRTGDHTAYVVRSDGPLPDLAPWETVLFPVGITAPEVPGTYRLMFSFGSELLPAGINGRPVKVSVGARSTANSMRN